MNQHFFGPAHPGSEPCGHVFVAALMLLGAAAVACIPARAGRDRCSAPRALTALATPLPHHGIAPRRERQSLTIVALGSSSTYGTGATSPNISYPSRLAALLRAQYPGDPNQGHQSRRRRRARRRTARIAREVIPTSPIS